MESIGSIHGFLVHHGRDISLASLAHGNVGRAVDRVLRAHDPGRKTRRSPLSLRLTLWLVLAMAMDRAKSIPAVFWDLVADWRKRLDRVRTSGLGDDALAHARARLGPEPLRQLFELTAESVQPPPTFHRYRVWAIDGVRITLPDTPANEVAFGRPPAGHRSGFPQLHLVTLAACWTHEIRAARWTRVPPNERGLGRELLTELGENDLLLVDRGFHAAWFIQEAMEHGIHFVVPIPRNVKPRIVARRSDGDYDVWIEPSAPSRRPSGSSPKRLYLRMIVYRIGKETYRLLTNLVDDAITKEGIAALYHERWEAEIVFDELKTRLATVRHGTPHTHFRGRSPPMVEQELWATLAIYNIVRGLMRTAAAQENLPPRHISFVGSLEVLGSYRRKTAQATCEQLPRLFQMLLEDLAACAIDRPRRSRHAPRVKKSRAKRYEPKKPTDRSRPRAPLQIIFGGAEP